MSKLNQVIYSNINDSNSWTIDEYLKQGGYSVWKDILADQENKNSNWIIEEVKKSGLRGRGGAGFPTGLKWSFMPNNDDQKYIVCNSDESEPGTCHDRDILKYNPHVLVEGMAIAAYAIGATVGYNYVRGEFMLECYPRIEAAVKEAYEAGLLGGNILESGVDFDLYNFLGAGAYICGEETGLLESLEGKQGKPRFKPPFPANFGLYGKPTTVNNTQTLASIPKIIENGSKWYSDFGTEKSPGTLIFSISGHINNPGNYELPLGLTFNEVIEIAGGILDERKLKAVIPGGSSTKVLPAKIIENCTMDYESLQSADSALGTGAMIIIAEDTCMVELLKRISRFYFAESCGQCTPCREGTGWLYRILDRITNGQGLSGDLSLLEDVAGRIEGNTICAFGDASAWPVQSFLKHYHHEFKYMIENKGKSVAAG
ncbi:MAG: NADH-quinone oxidoreductase subunit NuoF [Gammaproteobacteria bacterium]|jgi:NADH-quinone oxidoreductase subunit F|nr:NADH-quinone oxidoreductase subunit F [Gammaproteobacteria bacterium]MBQ08212.1 NADH-quinone oxidoreductase subunit F [Gammaproteobacteria bacterium]MDP6147451.1 NADH-quinone oxidoreductase subunit NuoF [Gammaproteobacteria bacterium]HJL79938.1 NADH-quinone oxidoreductase subunit NuoF [Gammaproteobacteria bacterium]HJM08802.1 NADH-quinone oxidoreductase subunit NuoF [Gammaproteobacteria bacterium]|tara:strand:- start:42557 stop:43843 length:1287 start_codon:yes stop_codon:yes gene_type:complete